MSKTINLPPKKRIALIAHDHKKQALLKWVAKHKTVLAQHKLFGTGTTGQLIENESGLNVHKLNSGPMGGDLQIAALVANHQLDVLIFFWDPMEAQPHDPDIRALLRICVVWNIPIANNRSTADFIISSPLFNESYAQEQVDYSKYIKRQLPEKD